MIEEWIEYRKDDPATHPGFEGAYLVTEFPAGSPGLEPREECGLSKFF